MDQDIRWKQRFSNYTKALSQLREFIEKEDLSKLEQQGLIQCFEYTFELAWKTMKDYLELEGFIVNSPRSAIQTAFQSGLISDGHLWIDALEKRNLMAHTYDEARAQEANDLIRNYYYHMLVDLHSTLKQLGNLA
ncbi:nucleotidyltransferase substrate binding protein [Gracilinema caldarium]|uniref:Nucleotidyltransferase substrate binding protein, HI0074 family n=1 Tax=Gracilinema caldarium (strain ATCC 51460 / DSM 7334 / H1) TaxID=744872 RepID=F8EZR7_GRAC1|nr:nucleotidyltransferase substrate binding protein [Gracilinema caldarium]AEJ20791.1 nucleotidyltransferase substrate binding protein, HI0074 family [Gracilinema caldarium DSM 7334]